MRQCTLRHLLTMNILCSRCLNNWWPAPEFSWREGRSIQYPHQKRLPASSHPVWSEGLPQSLWSPTLWRGRLINTAILSEVKSTDWRLHHHVSEAGRKKKESLVLEYRWRWWPHPTDRWRTLSAVHRIGQLWRFVILCQLYLELRHKVLRLPCHHHFML